MQFAPAPAAPLAAVPRSLVATPQAVLRRARAQGSVMPRQMAAALIRSQAQSVGRPLRSMPSPLMYFLALSLSLSSSKSLSVSQQLGLAQVISRSACRPCQRRSAPQIHDHFTLISGSASQPVNVLPQSGRSAGMNPPPLGPLNEAKAAPGLARTRTGMLMV